MSCFVSKGWICGKPAIAFVQVYLHRKKVRSYPICIEDGAKFLLYQELGQDWIRSALSSVLPIKKGTVPRFKVSLSP